MRNIANGVMPALSPSKILLACQPVFLSVCQVKEGEREEEINKTQATPSSIIWGFTTLYAKTKKKSYDMGKDTKGKEEVACN